jgi:hypothetical protein
MLILKMFSLIVLMKNHGGKFHMQDVLLFR